MSVDPRRSASLLVCVLAIFTCSCSSTSSTKSPYASRTPGPVDSEAPAEFTVTGSGLKYRILRQSDGPKPVASDTVLAHYVGTLDDGTEFDSSYSRGKPTDFPLRGVIAGWTEGLQLVGKGGMIELEIPYELGYGPGGMPGTIPPYATLHFKVELLDIL